MFSPAAGSFSPAADPQAPYVRLAVAGLILRKGSRSASGGPDRLGGGLGDNPEGGLVWLLLHRTDPVDAWDPPGGRMEEGEDLNTAVLREVREETGLAIQVAGPCYALLTVYKGERLLVVSMACRPLSDPDGVRLEPGGAIEWRWVSPEEWEELAAAGRSTWSALDVRRATRMSAALWEGEDD